MQTASANHRQQAAVFDTTTPSPARRYPHSQLIVKSDLFKHPPIFPSKLLAPLVLGLPVATADGPRNLSSGLSVPESWGGLGSVGAGREDAGRAGEGGSAAVRAAALRVDAAGVGNGDFASAAGVLASARWVDARSEKRD